MGHVATVGYIGSSVGTVDYIIDIVSSSHLLRLGKVLWVGEDIVFHHGVLLSSSGFKDDDEQKCNKSVRQTSSSSSQHTRRQQPV